MPKYITGLIFLFINISVCFSQNNVGIGTTTPDPSSILDLSAGELIIDNSILDFLVCTTTDCDSTNADFAFVVSLQSNSNRTINNTNKNNNAVQTQQNEDYTVTISPNPSDGIYYFVINKTGAYDISVYNSIGNLIIYETNINQNAVIDLSNQTAGIYYLRVSKENQVKHFKLIKR